MVPKSIQAIGKLKARHGIPLYQAACDKMAGLITSGRIEPHTRLPSERSLGEIMGISRMTARHVYNTLEEGGLVYRSDRRGWFVSSQQLKYGLTRSVSFVENVQGAGKKVQIEVLSATIDKPDAKTRDKLRLSKRETVYVIHRLLSVEDRPTMSETLCAPTALFPGLLDFPLDVSIASVWFEQYGAKVVRSEAELLSSRFTAADATDLAVTEHDFGVHISHLYFDKRDVPLGIDLQKWRNEGVVFCLNLNYT